MSTTQQQICPKCGGVIGGERSGAEKPCRCAPAGTGSDTVDEREGESGGEKKKVCCQCGKDLVGHRRFKDSVGYWCKDCHRRDKAQHQEAETRCPDCGRMRPINSMVLFQGRSICPTCQKEAVLVEKRKAAKLAAEAAHQAHEKRNLMIMVGIFALIVLIVLISVIRRKLMNH